MRPSRTASSAAVASALEVAVLGQGLRKGDIAFSEEIPTGQVSGELWQSRNLGDRAWNQIGFPNHTIATSDEVETSTPKRREV